MSTTTTATQAVLATAELLELILLNLPIKDILFAQKVCKQWKQLIDSSPLLQQALFLKPAPASSAAIDSKTLNLKFITAQGQKINRSPSTPASPPPAVVHTASATSYRTSSA
jgi:hypothetical protein